MFTRALKIVACILIMGLSVPLHADDADLSELEIADLAFMREEEKMARDVYAELYEYYKERGIELIVLANITLSEQKHMERHAQSARKVSTGGSGSRSRTR